MGFKIEWTFFSSYLSFHHDKIEIHYACSNVSNHRGEVTLLISSFLSHLRSVIPKPVPVSSVTEGGLLFVTITFQSRPIWCFKFISGGISHSRQVLICVSVEIGPDLRDDQRGEFIHGENSAQHVGVAAVSFVLHQGQDIDKGQHELQKRTTATWTA